MKKTNKNRKSIFSQDLPGQEFVYEDSSEKHPLGIGDHIVKSLETLTLYLNGHEKRKTTQIEKMKPSSAAKYTKDSIKNSTNEKTQSTPKTKLRNKHTYESLCQKLEETAQAINNSLLDMALIHRLFMDMHKITCKEERIDIAYIFWQHYLSMAIAKQSLQKQEAAWKAIVEASYYQGLIEGLQDVNTEGLAKRASAGGLGKARSHPATKPARIKAEGIAIGIMLSSKPETGWNSYSEAAHETIDTVLQMIEDHNLHLPKERNDLESLLTNLAADHRMNEPTNK